MVRVKAVQDGSIAEELGIVPGTELVSVNGRELADFLDWEFLTADEAFLLHVRHPDGEEIEFDIERPLGEGLGVGLEPPRIRRCAWTRTKMRPRLTFILMVPRIFLPSLSFPVRRGCASCFGHSKRNPG